MPPRGDQWTRTATRIFRTIWRNPNISRIDLADTLGLDKSTVTKQVAYLIDNGLIIEKEEGEASSRGGRKADLSGGQQGIRAIYRNRASVGLL